MVHSAAGATATTTKPLTMFYNGGVAMFHLPQDKVHGLTIHIPKAFCTCVRARARVYRAIDLSRPVFSWLGVLMYTVHACGHDDRRRSS